VLFHNGDFSAALRLMLWRECQMRTRHQENEKVSMFALGMGAINKIITKAETLCEDIADISIFIIMLIVFSDIAMRYLLNSPIGWAYDVISLYLMAAAFFLSLSSAYTAHCHIGMDVFVRLLPPQGQRAMEIVTCVLAIPLFSLITIIATERAFDHWTNNDAISGLIPWPTWIGAAFVPIGTGLLIVRLFFRLVGQIANLASGKDIFGSISASGEHAAE
jgi:TRAP-type C4-dicarboxylate transport system permease small subunit